VLLRNCRKTGRERSHLFVPSSILLRASKAVWSAAARFNALVGKWDTNCEYNCTS
jgi:hypothetical protein